MYQELINKLKEDLPGYHFTIEIYPSGGIIDANACEECGTTENYSCLWNIKRNTTMDTAVEKLMQLLKG